MQSQASVGAAQIPKTNDFQNQINTIISNIKIKHAAIKKLPPLTV